MPVRMAASADGRRADTLPLGTVMELQYSDDMFGVRKDRLQIGVCGPFSMHVGLCEQALKLDQSVRFAWSGGKASMNAGIAENAPGGTGIPL